MLVRVLFFANPAERDSTPLSPKILSEVVNRRNTYLDLE
jgi:hypothetical protein